jgi:hypothetical protein
MYPDLGAWVEEHIPALGSGWRSGSWPGSGSVTRWADLRPSRRLCLRAAPGLRPAGQAVIPQVGSDRRAGYLVRVMLIFVILVGQGVLGWSADRRSGRPFQDAEEILQEGAQGVA